MKANKTIKFPVSLRIPTVPNYIICDECEEDAPNRTIDVAALDDNTLMAIGAAWTERLVEHSQNRRRRKKDPK